MVVILSAFFAEIHNFLGKSLFLRYKCGVDWLIWGGFGG